VLCVRKRSLHKGMLQKKIRDCFAATCGVWKLAVKFRPSRHLRKWLALWRYRRASTFTMTKSLPSYRIFRNLSLPKTMSRAIPAKDAHLLAMFCRLFGRMKERDLGLVLFMAQKMARWKVV
jgi:hypothetical protein